MIGSAAEVARFGVTIIVFRLIIQIYWSQLWLFVGLSWFCVFVGLFLSKDYYLHLLHLGQKMDLRGSTRRGLSQEKYMKSPLLANAYQITLNSRYSGDLCPIDVDTIDDAEDLGTCLTLKVRFLPKYALNVNHSAGWRNGQVVCEEPHHRRKWVFCVCQHIPQLMMYPTSSKLHILRLKTKTEKL